jgi:DNA mismatch endonuclease (patch repair protein)
MKENKPESNKKFIFDTTPERSARMSNIRSKDTGPEIKLRKALWQCGIRYRINVKKLPGKPDIVIGSKKIAIFVDGEFWHGYEWDLKKEKIKSNRDYWIPKIERNMERDSQNNTDLKDSGYVVLRFWEHEITKHLSDCLDKIKKHYI